MFDTFPPKEFPLMLSISFSKQETELRQQIKSIFKIQSPKDIKYRNRMNLSCSFDCYFKNVDAMRPILNQVLKDTEMIIPLIMEKDKSVFVRDLLSEAQKIIQDKNLSK